MQVQTPSELKYWDVGSGSRLSDEEERKYGLIDHDPTTLAFFAALSARAYQIVDKHEKAGRMPIGSCIIAAAAVERMRDGVYVPKLTRPTPLQYAAIGKVTSSSRASIAFWQFVVNNYRGFGSGWARRYVYNLLVCSYAHDVAGYTSLFQKVLKAPDMKINARYFTDSLVQVLDGVPAKDRTMPTPNDVLYVLERYGQHLIDAEPIEPSESINEIAPEGFEVRHYMSKQGYGSTLGLTYGPVYGPPMEVAGSVAANGGYPYLLEITTNKGEPVMAFQMSVFMQRAHLVRTELATDELFALVSSRLDKLRSDARALQALADQL